MRNFEFVEDEFDFESDEVESPPGLLGNLSSLGGINSIIIFIITNIKNH